MLVHVYKAGGDWKDAEGFEYTIKTVHQTKDLNNFINEGWLKTLEEAKKTEAPKEEEYRKMLALEIKKLGGTPHGKSGIDKLELQLEELKSKAE